MNERQKIKLVVIDGPSGSGKDTLIDTLATRLSFQRTKFLQISEDKLDPNRGAIKQARDRGKSRGGTGDREMANEIILHRSQIYERALAPLEKGHDRTIVLANRGLPATLAYQTLRGEVSMEEIWAEHQYREIPNPDLVVITYCCPEVAQLREERRNSNGVGLSGSVTKEVGASPEETLRRRRSLHQSFEQVAGFLRGKKIRVLELDTEVLTVQDEADIVLRHI